MASKLNIMVKQTSDECSWWHTNIQHVWISCPYHVQRTQQYCNTMWFEYTYIYTHRLCTDNCYPWSPRWIKCSSGQELKLNGIAKGKERQHAFQKQHIPTLQAMIWNSMHLVICHHTECRHEQWRHQQMVSSTQVLTRWHHWEQMAFKQIIFIWTLWYTWRSKCIQLSNLNKKVPRYYSKTSNIQMSSRLALISCLMITLHLIIWCLPCLTSSRHLFHTTNSLRIPRTL